MQVGLVTTDNVKTTDNVTKLRHYALTIQLIMSQQLIMFKTVSAMTLWG